MRLTRLFVASCLSVQFLLTASALWAQGGPPPGMGPSPEMIAKEKARLIRVHASIDKKLTLVQQKAVYYKITVAEYQAYSEAKKKYAGQDDPEVMITRAGEEHGLLAKYKGAVATASGLTGEEGDVLENTGNAAKWPAHVRRDPSHPRIKPNYGSKKH